MPELVHAATVDYLFATLGLGAFGDDDQAEVSAAFLPLPDYSADLSDVEGSLGDEDGVCSPC